MKARFAAKFAFTVLFTSLVSTTALASWDDCRDLILFRERVMQVDLCQTFDLSSLHAHSDFKGSGCDLMIGLMEAWQRQQPLIDRINGSLSRLQTGEVPALDIETNRDIILLHIRLAQDVRRLLSQGEGRSLDLQLVPDVHGAHNLKPITGFQIGFESRWSEGRWLFKKDFQYDLPLTFETVASEQYRSCIDGHCRVFYSDGRPVSDSLLPSIAQSECPILSSER